jgi:eight-cysteine-cluster-containing protein
MKTLLLYSLVILLLFVLISSCKPERQPLPDIVIKPVLVEQKSECLSDKDCPQPRCPGVKGVCKSGVCEIQGKCEFYECKTDDDCMKSGCSGQICQSKYSEPSITTCDFLPEYACYQQAKCGCTEGRCGFANDIVLKQCFARETGKRIEPAKVG